MGFSKKIDLEVRISDPYSDQLDAVPQWRTSGQLLKNLVYNRSLPLAVRSVNAKNLNDDHFRFYV